MTTKRVRLTETADLAAAASHFRLLDLPFDLRECVSQFVDRRTAARLLTLSSGCHELFARSVWRCIDKRIFNSSVSNETRASAFARYGRLVRRVDFQGLVHRLDYSVDLSQLVPNVTTYEFKIGNNNGDIIKQALHLIHAVSGFHGLRSLAVAFSTYYRQFGLAPLADALVSRQQNQNWQCLRRFNLVFTPHIYKCPWADMTRFVVKVKPLQIDEFEITIEGTASDYPTAEQMALIAPHLTGIPNIKISDDISPCRAHHNRIFYRSQYLSGNDGLVVFPHLKSLRIYLCCASSAVYDYADFTPARFPRVETVNIIMFDCRRRTMYSGRASVHPALSQCWPNASTVELYGVTTSSALYALLDHNPQITNLRVETSSHRTNNAQISRFSLADILKRLPMLDTLSIKLSTGERFYGNSENGADSNEDNDLLYIKNSRLKNIHIKHLTMTGECLEVLYMLPKLKDIAFMYCNLDNPEVALEKVKRIQKLNKTRKRGKYGAHIGHIRFEKVKLKGYGYWPVKLAAAMVAAAPNIKKVTLEGDASELISAIRKRFPTITLFRLGHIRLMYRPGVLCH